MKTCEVEKPTGKGKNRVYTLCGKPAAYFWKPRNGRDGMYACAECGPQLAGNFTDELTQIEAALTAPS